MKSQPFIFIEMHALLHGYVSADHETHTHTEVCVWMEPVVTLFNNVVFSRAAHFVLVQSIQPLCQLLTLEFCVTY